MLRNSDINNIFLMILSVLLALALPFEVFLISYAVLGPLHYVTEISWLQKKQYFILEKKDWLALLIICVVAALLMLTINYLPNFKDQQLLKNFLTKNNLSEQKFFDELSFLPSCLVFFVFFSAFILTFIKDWYWRINAFALSLILILLFKGTPNYTIIFGIFLTTIIHVWIFTGIFILSGAINSKKILSYFSFVVFILCALSFVFITIENYRISSAALQIITNQGLVLNRAILQFFDFSVTNDDLISTSQALKVQAFIAFAYTYHYLNWFSKVEIIKWHKVSKNSLIFSGIIWLISLTLYFYDYRLGTSFLLFLSILHVFLEFPLNFRSIATIANRIS
ncbi:MAG: hypothetical protein SFV53_05440 [Rickettsiales bacterium]|nr:hypothetical protein [Rickettsiales bacterium]